MILIPSSETRQRFGGISVMTEFRRRRDGLMPKAIRFNGRNFDREDQVIEQQKLVIANATKERVIETVAKFDAENAAGATTEAA